MPSPRCVKDERMLLLYYPPSSHPPPPLAMPGAGRVRVCMSWLSQPRVLFPSLTAKGISLLALQGGNAPGGVVVGRHASPLRSNIAHSFCEYIAVLISMLPCFTGSVSVCLLCALSARCSMSRHSPYQTAEDLQRQSSSLNPFHNNCLILPFICIAVPYKCIMADQGSSLCPSRRQMRLYGYCFGTQSKLSITVSTPLYCTQPHGHNL